MHTCVVQIPCENAESARVLLETLRLEAEDGPEGSAVALHLEDAALRIHMEAPDVATLRAAMNSMLRLLDTARRVVAGQ